MRITTLKKNETSAGALVQRLYPNLSESQRKKAEADLLKANPHLAEAAAFKPDTVVKLPDTPEFKAKAGAAEDDPIEAALEQLKEVVAGYRHEQTQHIDAELAAIASQEELLKDKEVAAAIKRSPDAGAIAETLKAYLRDGKKALETEAKKRDALFETMLSDMGALFKQNAR